MSGISEVALVTVLFIVQIRTLWNVNVIILWQQG